MDPKTKLPKVTVSIVNVGGKSNVMTTQEDNEKTLKAFK